MVKEYECLKDYYEELGDVEFELLNIAERLNNLELKVVVSKLTNILNRMAIDFGQIIHGNI